MFVLNSQRPPRRAYLLAYFRPDQGSVDNALDSKSVLAAAIILRNKIPD